MSYDDQEDDDYSQSGCAYTVSMKGAPNMAMVQWAGSERDAIIKTARDWGCKPDMLYIYRGLGSEQ